MEIISFRIRKYRHIQDSGDIELHGNLTCVVGKNQSGKTAVLRALHKFNPHEPVPYNITREWPRGERRTRDPAQIVCEVKFALSEAEKHDLGELTSEKMTADHVFVTKDYDGNFEVHFPEKPDLFPDLSDDLPQLAAPVGEPFQAAATECIEEVRRLVREGRFEDLALLEEAHDKSLRDVLAPGNPQPNSQNETTFLNAYGPKLKELIAGIEALRTMQREAHDYIVGHIPTFIYMDDYREFEGTALLDQVQARQKKKPTPEDQTFLMILKLSGLDLDQLVEQGESDESEDVHERQYDLDDAARTLTNDVAGRWGQNPYRVQFRADGQTFFTEIEETDEGRKNIGMIPLEEQSKGFRWFFSFDLRFAHDSEGTFEGCVLLLDEPGLHLHPGAQDDLLKRLDKYSQKNTLIYTTHLPFLVDLREPSRIRVISQTTDGAAVVTDDLGASGPDEKLTLQAALGMRLNQHYLVSQRNLIVEGVDDFWIVAQLSSLFERSDQPGLPDDIEITAAGGAPEVVYMTTLMIGQNLEAVALFDSDAEGRRQEEKLRTKWLTRYKDAKSNTVLLGDAIEETNDVAIEDLFTEKYYLEKVEASHAKKMRNKGVKKIKLTKGGLLCNRVSEACEKVDINFNKGSAAKLIRKDLAKMSSIDELDADTREKAEKLFKALREAFSN